MSYTVYTCVSIFGSICRFGLAETAAHDDGAGSVEQTTLVIPYRYKAGVLGQRRIECIVSDCG
jgi:hypothetical protein